MARELEQEKRKEMNWKEIKSRTYTEISNAIQLAVAYEPNNFET